MVAKLQVYVCTRLYRRDSQCFPPLIPKTYCDMGKYMLFYKGKRMLESNRYRSHTSQTLHHRWGFATQPLPERTTLPPALTMPGALLLGTEGVHSLLHSLIMYYI